jgi:hypothetical protein
LVPATIPQQNAIVTYLHGSARDIFTDIAPAESDSLAEPVKTDATDVAEKPADGSTVHDEEPVKQDAAGTVADNNSAADTVKKDAAA